MEEATVSHFAFLSYMLYLESTVAVVTDYSQLQVHGYIDRLYVAAHQP